MGLKLVFRARDCDWLQDVMFWWVEGQFGNSIYCFFYLIIVCYSDQLKKKYQSTFWKSIMAMAISQFYRNNIYNQQTRT